MAGAALEFRVLGPLEVVRAGVGVPIGSQRQRRFLGALLLNEGRLTPWDRIFATVWPDQEPSRTARNAIQVCASHLRSLLGPEVGITAMPEGYRVDLSGQEVDLLRFRALRTQARDADPAERVILLRQATALWRGPLLAGTLPDEAADTLFAGLTEERLAATEDRVDAELAVGSHREVIAELTELVRENPLRERLAGQLMLALYRDGRLADSLEAFRRAQHLIREHLGSAPSAALEDLHRQILAGDPSLQPPSRTPGRMFLPRDVADFTGRQSSLAWLDRLSGEGVSTAVISAVEGAGGTGKTALAVHWAHRHAASFPDGVFYVNLHGYDQGEAMAPADALTVLLDCLGTPPAEIPDNAEVAASRYRALLAGKRVLILLDNARSVDQVRPLLPGDSRCLVLVTSRERLTGLFVRDGARHLSLGSLTEDESLQLLARLLGEARVASETPAAQRLHDLCGGLPLAVRIAAAHLLERPSLTITEYADRLARGRRLETLAVEGDDESAVAAVIGQSVRALDPRARAMFAALGTVPGRDFAAEAAAALTAVPLAEAQSTLDQLVAAHMLEHQDGRYTFHDLVGEYAQGVAHPDREACFERLLDYYRDLAGSAVEAAGTPGAESSAATLVAERLNLIAAFLAAAEQGRWDVVNGIAEALRRHAQAGGGFLRPWTAALEHVVRMAESAEADHPDLADLLFALTFVLVDLARYDEALSLLARYRELRQKAGDWRGEARYHNRRARIHVLQEAYEPALQELHACLDLYRRHGDREKEAETLGGALAVTYNLAGRPADAIEVLHEALAIVEETGSASNLLRVRINLAEAYLHSGDTAEAHRIATSAQELLSESGSAGLESAEGAVLEILAEIHLRWGQNASALQMRRRCLELARYRDTPLGICEQLTELGRTHEALSDMDAAYAAYAEAASIAQASGLRKHRVRLVSDLERLGADRLTDAGPHGTTSM